MGVWLQWLTGMHTQERRARFSIFFAKGGCKQSNLSTMNEV